MMQDGGFRVYFDHLVSPWRAQHPKLAPPIHTRPDLLEVLTSEHSCSFRIYFKDFEYGR